MKILVTGGTGLIGSALKEYVESIVDKNTWIFLSRKDCNLLEHLEVVSVFTEINPDYIIHLAAEVGGLFKNMTEKVKMLENNILINFNVLQVANQLNIQNVMCCLSTCIFPDKVVYPIKEEFLHDGPPHDSNYAYAYAKRLLDVHCRAYREQCNRNYFCVIPTNVYGPHDNFNLKDGHVIPALIHQCYLAKQDNKPFYVKGSGKPLRQFIYSLDIAKCIYHLLFNYKISKSIILSVSEKDETTIGQVAELIAEAMSYKKIEFQNEFPDGQFKKSVNNDLLISLLPSDFTFMTIQKGITETVKWFCDNYDIARL